MRVCYFVESFPHFSETFIYNQFYEIYKKGHNCTFVFLKDTGFEVNHSIVSKIEQDCKLLKFKNNVTFKILTNLFRFPFKAIRLLIFFPFKQVIFYVRNLHIVDEMSRSNIIHTHFGNNGKIISKLFEAKIFMDVKLVNSFHGFDLDPFKIEIYKTQYRALFQYGSLFLVNTIFAESLLLSIQEGIKNRVMVLPVGVDYELFLESSSRHEANMFSLIFIGRLIKLKGAMVLLEISKKIIEKGIELQVSIVGEGEEMEALLEYCEKYGLNRNIFFHGALSQEEIKSLLERSTILVAPGIKDPSTGRCETQGLVVQEAQASGLPVIVSDVGGMKYGLIDGKTGFVVQEGNIEGFVERVLFFYRNRESVKKFGDEGRKFVESSYRNDFLVDKLLTKYRSL